CDPHSGRGSDPALRRTPAPAEPNTLALVGWLAVPATAFGYLLFVTGLRHVTAAAAGTLSLAEPLVAALLGLTLLGEQLPWPAGAGAGLLLTGLVVATMPVPRRSSTWPSEIARQVVPVSGAATSAR